ncbi:hypothetical protein GCM10025883_18910 [Mobilicoccus caccae]|uniref:Uncharacterized protein n=1 Tax=Mobilicoccus caccae TaxID=1859295 RepID=A0ABQ6IQW7_9MICO|nr:hypothetical protein GCM10025883_18910 [Mobilicoccus caccae]
MLAHELAQGGDGGHGLGSPFGGRHQAEVAARDDDVGAPRQDSEDGDPGHRDAVACLTFVSGRGDVVEDHPADADAGVEGREPVDEGADAAGGRGAVDDEDDRRAGQFGDVGAAREPLAAEGAVEQTHDALDDGDVRGRRGHRAVEQQRDDAFDALHVGVEIAAASTRGGAVIPRIDVVGADLVWAHLEPPRTQRRQQAGGHHRLAAARGRGREQDPGQGEATGEGSGIRHERPLFRDPRPGTALGRPEFLAPTPGAWSQWRDRTGVAPVSSDLSADDR